jgi:threonine synthase
MWDFAAFMPHFSNNISLYEGNTPLLSFQNFPNLKGLKAKLEFRNPTGSFRDRAASLLMSDAAGKKMNSIISASTGSFSISLAAYAAKAKLKCKSVVPQNLELSKIEQLKLYGSDIVQTGSTLEEAMEAAKSIVIENPAENFYRPTPTENILMIEGQKTIGLELALQFPEIQNVIVPKGSGSLIYSVYRGFQDAIASGWIQSMPVFYAVSLDQATDVGRVESLEMGEVTLFQEIPRILKETNGKDIHINPNLMVDDSILLAKKEGLFIEPASGSVIAAARLLIQDSIIKLDETATILSGSGINALNLFASEMRETKKVVWGLSAKSTTKFEILGIIASNKADQAAAICSLLPKEKDKKSPTVQSIYQHLAELEEKGLLIAKMVDKKQKRYILTKKGTEFFEKLKDIIDFL